MKKVGIKIKDFINLAAHAFTGDWSKENSLSNPDPVRLAAVESAQRNSQLLWHTRIQANQNGRSTKPRWPLDYSIKSWFH